MNNYKKNKFFFIRLNKIKKLLNSKKFKNYKSDKIRLSSDLSEIYEICENYKKIINSLLKNYNKNSYDIEQDIINLQIELFFHLPQHLESLFMELSKLFNDLKLGPFEKTLYKTNIFNKCSSKKKKNDISK